MTTKKQAQQARTAARKKLYADVRQLHGEGRADGEIAEQLGLERWKVHQIRSERLGLPLNPGSRHAVVDPQRYVKLHERGLNSSQIAEELGVSPHTVTAWLRRLLGQGWSSSSRQPATPEQVATIERLAGEGYPDDWIAEEVGLTRDTVARYRLKVGIPAPEGWVGTRLAIQHNPKMFALHREFAPKVA